jgi:UDP-N-acetylglucosamine 2-epimerase (non-hydrolysing)
MSKRIMFILGTRPEAIKLAPVILYAQSRPGDFEVRVCATAQHREMLDQVLELFSISPDIDLGIMSPGQDLFDLTANLVLALKPVLREERPDWVIVQGDTTTVWTGALAAFYEDVRVGHVEAGLRTFDKRQPFPEEINRRLCTQLTDLHFAPTQRSRQALLAENIPEARIVVTGNTVIDALLWVANRIEVDPPEDVVAIRKWASRTLGSDRMVLITGHRRESFGEGFENICGAIAQLSMSFRHVHWVYPVHLNPNVQEPVHRILSRRENVHLLAPQAYAPFTWLMQRSELILTDSGGIQEEAPSLGKYVLVMRNTTERPEGIEAGWTKLVGDRQDSIIEHASTFLQNPSPGEHAVTENPYGDGQASQRIADALAADQAWSSEAP